MADSTASSIVVAAGRPAVMAVISDFGAYPDWAAGVRSATVVETGTDGRARRVRFALDAGVIKDSYVLAYEWDGDAAARWTLAEPGTVVTELTGSYRLSDAEAPAGGSGTVVSYELAVGTRLPLPGLLKRRAEKTIIEAALAGLKSRVEASS